MVTGDRADVAAAVGAVIGVDEVLAERLLLTSSTRPPDGAPRAPTIMVGDGTTTRPLWPWLMWGSRWARGARRISQAADAVLTVDRLGRLGEVAALARRTRIARQSSSPGWPVAGCDGAGRGWLPSGGVGALLQEGIDVSVILNALRALRPGACSMRLTAADAALTTRFRGAARERSGQA